MKISKLEEFAMFDRLILNEVNVKKISRFIAQTEKGELWLSFDGQQYFYEMNGEDVSTPKLMEKAPDFLDLLFNNYVKA